MRFADFIRAGYVHVENPATGRVEPIHLYPVQEDFARDVWDTPDPLTGLRRYRVAIFCVPKKFGKTTFAAAQGLYHVLFDRLERDREGYSIAGDKDQALIVVEKMKAMIRHSPELQELVTDGTLKVYKEELVVEDVEGVHRFQALASDSPTGHGINPSLVIVDEAWQLRTYELLEAVALGPQRRCPLQLWVTYAGLKASMVDGVPLYDLYKRGLAGTDPKLYFCWRSGLRAYAEVPPGFIRDGYLDEQRMQLPRNRFQRLHLNEWGARDVGFLTDEELAAATAPALTVLARSQAPHALAVDYGRTKDHTALALVRRGDRPAKLAISDTQIFCGTPEHPVPLEVVERTIVDLVSRFNVQRIVVDPYQMLGTCERLAKRLGLPMFDTEKAEKYPRRRAIVMRPIGPQYLNRLTKGLLSLFRSRNIQIPAALTELLAQLESVIVKEDYYGIRIDSGAGEGVRAHDDIVIALGMAALDLVAGGSGLELPALVCSIPDAPQRCLLHTPTLAYEDAPSNLCLRTCDAWKALVHAHRLALEDGEKITLREFARTRVQRPAGAGFRSIDVSWL
jgi:hypothetical protein